MTRTAMLVRFWFGSLFALAGDQASSADDPVPTKPRTSGQTPEAIDFTKGRELLKKQQRGEKLSAEEETYLRKAQAARREEAQNGTSPNKPQRRLNGGEPRETTGLRPLSEMTADDRYQGEDGGLYGDGLAPKHLE